MLLGNKERRNTAYPYRRRFASLFVFFFLYVVFKLTYRVLYGGIDKK